MVEPTNFCNFNCPLCDKGSGKLTRPEGSISLDNFTRILDDIGSGLKLLLLWNQGEPFINRELPAIVRAAKKRRIFTIISTNGSLLERNAADIVDSGLDEIIVSLDAANPETYNRYRRGGDFRVILEGVRELVRQRDGKSTPLISLQFLLLKHNLSEIADFKRLAADIGADRVLWKTVQVTDEKMAGTFLPSEGRFTRYSDSHSLKLKRFRYDCRRILYSAVIDWNGNVVPCCFDKNEDFLLGNAFTENFNNIWRGDKFVHFRDIIANGKRPRMCANCTEGLRRLFIS